jgi:hypothetical protein
MMTSNSGAVESTLARVIRDTDARGDARRCFVDPTEVRCAKLTGVVRLRLGASRVGPKYWPAKHGDASRARACFDRAVTWLKTNSKQIGQKDQELKVFRAEAESLLRATSGALPDDVFAGVPQTRQGKNHCPRAFAHGAAPAQRLSLGPGAGVATPCQ